MNIKTFKIRTDELYKEYDEKLINDFLNTVDVIEISSIFVTDSINYWSIIIQYTDKKNEEIEYDTFKKIKYEKSDLNDGELDIVQRIKTWRDEKAKQESLPVYMVLLNSDIYSVVKEKPINFLELSKVHGWGEKKIEKFGKEILTMIHS